MTRLSQTRRRISRWTRTYVGGRQSRVTRGDVILAAVGFAFLVPAAAVIAYGFGAVVF